jgi:hypothetical protein
MDHGGGRDRRSSNTKTGNRLLDAMPSESLERLRPFLEPVDLALAEPVPATEHADFPIVGLISVVATMADGTAVEVGMSGREGMHSLSAVLSEDAASDVAMVQLPGRALWINAHPLRKEMQTEVAVRTLLLRYTLAFVSAVAQSGACNRLHLLEQRCARWLLACRERAEGDTFPMTHEFLAVMLGVRGDGCAEREWDAGPLPNARFGGYTALVSVALNVHRGIPVYRGLTTCNGCLARCSCWP